MFDYERKPYLQRIFGHLYICHHKTLLHVWFSIIRVRVSADCSQSGPGCGLWGWRGRRDECFIQPIICFKKITGTMLIFLLSFVSSTLSSGYTILESWDQMLKNWFDKKKQFWELWKNIFFKITLYQEKSNLALVGQNLNNRKKSAKADLF